MKALSLLILLLITSATQANDYKYAIFLARVEAGNEVIAYVGIAKPPEAIGIEVNIPKTDPGIYRCYNENGKAMMVPLTPFVPSIDASINITKVAEQLKQPEVVVPDRPLSSITEDMIARVTIRMVLDALDTKQIHTELQ